MTAESQFGQSPAKTALLTLRFVTELALLGVLVIVGVEAGVPTAGRIALAVASPVVAAAIWGIAIGPRARRRLPDPARLAVEVVLFGAAAAGLAIEGSVIGAVIFAVVTVGVGVLVRVVTPGG
jgi:hypothetical protein